MEELKKYTNIETVTRDLSSTYKSAIAEALPDAKQIADRFHIEKNYTDNMIDYMKRTIDDKIVLNKNVDGNKRELSSYEKNKEATALKKWRLIEKVKELKSKNMSNVSIGKELGLCSETVAKYLKLDKPPIQESHSKLDAYIPDIKQAIMEKKTKKEIYEYIQCKGYTGKKDILFHRLKSIRSEVKQGLVTIKRSQLKKILFIDEIDEIKKDSIKQGIKLYLQQNEEFNNLVELLKEFKSILFSKDSSKLEPWLEKSKRINVQELTSFCCTIENDLDAVKNAIIYDYSNGLTEGFNNKTKVIKRQMYGRCSFDLLKTKVLA